MKRKILIVTLAAVMILSVVLAVACNKIKGGFEWDEYRGSSVEFGNSEVVMPTDIPAKADEPTLALHYYRRNANDYKTWGYWLWADGKDGELYKIQYQDDFGSVTLVPLSIFGVGSNGKIGLIPRLQSAWTKDGESDRFVNLSDYTMDENNYYHVYLAQADLILYKDIEQMKHGLTAAFDAQSKINISAKAPVKHIEVLENGKVIGKADTDRTASIRFIFDEGQNPEIGNTYVVKATFEDGYVGTVDVNITSLYETDAFNDQYYYDGELGAIYTSSQTTFRVWSPVSTKIVLNLYDVGLGGKSFKTEEMTKGDKGVFEAVVSGDLGGKYYTYTVYNSTYPEGKEIVDPYAKSAGVNGVRGMIVDFHLTNPDGWDDITPHQYDKNELIIWETHVSDVTSSDTWGGSAANSKKFKGMYEAGTTYTSNGVTVSTGFDHIKELGVNAVELQPIFDQANDEINVNFNWGYNPLNYNVLEGAYSSDPTDGYARIREFKELVMAYNEAGINIIMDVVYNHVSGAFGSNFDVLMPGYYFRYNANGDMDNGSGCGNDTASEHAMYHKFMVDSVTFWAKEYKLGGFRFDIMGLHDIDTMNEIYSELQKINPSIVVFGEPWDISTSLNREIKAMQSNAAKIPGIGVFNDQIRDPLIKGGMNSTSSKGWVTQTDVNSLSPTDITRIVKSLGGIVYTGSDLTNLTQTINYVTCHDDYTLFDRIKAAGITNAAQAKQMAMLANSVVLTSNGVSFMLAGEEFLRSKEANGAIGEEIHNSYNASYKVNELNYALKITNKDMFENYQKLIDFKKSFVDDMGLTATTVSTKFKAQQVAGSGGAVIEITINANNGTWKIIHANGAVGNVTVDFAGYSLYLDTLNSGVTLSANTPISPFQTIIAKK